MNRRTLIKDILWIIVFVGTVAAVFRFILGLGYTTGLNDAAPWGLWIALKLAFIALAGGGFTLAAIVYIFQIETYRPIIRRAILIALLGYGAFVTSLLFDLGLPWRIYMPVIHWQPHSVMFEIAWCVILYFTVLNLEFGPVILEHHWFQHPLFQWILRTLHRLTIPIVIAGIVLSTLHQSSLGSLFLIMPFRVHPLWYSPLIPVLFFISAIGLGLMAVILDGFTANWLFGHDSHPKLLSRLGQIAAWVLWIYLIVRISDLVWRGILPAALDGSWQNFLFMAEILIGGVLPATLLLIPRVRNSREGLITSGVLVAFGIISQRMSLSLLTMRLPEQTTYLPSLFEIAIAVAVPAAAGLLYFFFAENLAVLQQKVPEHRRSPYAGPQFNQSTQVYIENSFRNTFIRRSTLAIFFIALTMAVLPSSIVTGQTLPRTPIKAALGWEIMTINGNRDQNRVDFNHLDHQARLEEKDPDNKNICSTCHHLSMPNDEATACWECHQDMNRSTSIFDHTLHQAYLGGNASCIECHQGEHTAQTAKACGECHETMEPKAGETTFNDSAPGYEEAMHGTCLTCHEQEAQQQNRPELGQCPACHTVEYN
ncbi:MAG: polysulfide reductase NrfD [Desulfobacteraceae bacterium]|jgi:Ni/Fe-hydrogenase subunit HybB-like protein